MQQTNSSIPTESVEQQCLFRWAQYQSGKYPELSLMYHVPNEGKRSRATGGRMRAEGLKAGVPDICLPVPCGAFHGLYIELKRTQGGKVTGNQSNWLTALEKQGYYAVVCEGWEVAAAVIEKYLRLERVGNGRHIYFFRLLTMLTQKQKNELRKELKQQISEGLVLFGNSTEFVKREIKVLGENIRIEFVEEETDNENH